MAAYKASHKEATRLHAWEVTFAPTPDDYANKWSPGMEYDV
jgi:hypothetical protein